MIKLLLKMLILQPGQFKYQAEVAI